jgi:Fe-S-cluster-containing dehydrogenase component
MECNMDSSRRRFLKQASLAATGALPLAAPDVGAQEPIDCDHTYGVLVDTAVCIGCRKCEWACNNQHKLNDKPLAEYEDRSVFDKHRRPTKNAYTVVNRFGVSPEVKDGYTMKVQCMHCNHPACVSACIVGALEKTELGPVSYDAWKCIGCRYCMVACPFQVPAYEYDNALDPQVRKCTFCAERLHQGERPACVSICPNEALTFGTRSTLLDIAHARIRKNPERYVNHVYGEAEAGGTSWMYLAPVSFDKSELPALPKEKIPEITESIQHGIFKSFLPPLALYGLLGLIMHSANSAEKQEKQDREEVHDEHA